MANVFKSVHQIDIRFLVLAMINFAFGKIPSAKNKMQTLLVNVTNADLWSFHYPYLHLLNVHQNVHQALLLILLLLHRLLITIDNVQPIA